MHFYFDVVLENNHRDVVLNDTPEKVKEFLLLKIEDRKSIDSYCVVDGLTLTPQTVEEYLSR